MGAWLIYLLTSFLLYPYLRITVMLLSIPLTMLGAWFYRYKGAVLTTLLIIPYHVVMLHYYAIDPTLVLEAINPMGISTQLFFSCWTALLKSNSNRYHQLTNSLEHIVEDQTADLRLLTEYLQDLGEMERNHVLRTLLDAPNNELKKMLSTSSLLQTHLKDTNHAGLDKAETVTRLVETCLGHMQSSNQSSSPTTVSTFDIETALTELTTQLQEVSGVNIQVAPMSDWSTLSQKETSYIYHIIHEALTNALRHADPTNIEIGLTTSDRSATVYISNDGKELSPTYREGMGVSLMKYRARKIGSTLTLSAAPGVSATVKCVIPLDG